MLKHVHSSPHRSSSTSLKRSLIDGGSPKHIRQTSSPSSLCNSCSYSKDGSKLHLNFTSSTLTLEESGRSPNNSSSTCAKAEGEHDLLNLSIASIPELRPIRSRASSEPPIICPKCFKKKKKPVIFSETFKHNVSSNPLREDEVPIIGSNNNSTAVPQSSLNSSSDSLPKLSPSKNASCNSCACHKHNLNTCPPTTLREVNLPRCSTPIESRPLIGKCQSSEDENGASSSSSPSSPSQSSSSSGTSSKRVMKTDEKIFRGRLDNLSLDSSMSCSTSSREDALCSLSSSAVSLPDNLKQSMVRVWVRCLMQEMEYKTICVSYSTTCRQVVKHLLSKFRMKHRDPNLFYLAMEVTLRKADAEVRTCLRLDDTSFPAQLVECHPREYSRLALRMRRGGLIRIYDQAVSKGSHYKSLLVGEKISCNDVISLVLACNKVEENINNFVLVEVWHKDGTEKILHPEDEPMIIASEWEDKEAVRFEMRRVSNSTNQNASHNDVTNLTPPLIESTNENEELNLNTKAHGCDNDNSMPAGDDNFKSKQILDYDDDKSAHNSSSSSSSDCPSSPSTCSTPLQSESNANITIENKYLSKLRGKMSPKTCSIIFHGEAKQRRKLPKTPDGSTKLAPPLTSNENDGGKTLLPLNKKMEFKTYNDYENYFYI